MAAENVVDFTAAYERQMKEIDHIRDQAKDGLKSGGGGGTFDGMEHRISSLEKAFEKMDGKLDATIADIADLKTQTAVLSERISHLPSKEFIYKGIAGLITVMVAVSVLAPKLQALFGLAVK